MHIIEGCAGNAEVMSPGKYPMKDFTVKRDANTGYGILNLHNRSHLTYQHWLSKNKTVFDSFTYDKSDPRPFKLDNESMVAALDFKTFVAGILVVTLILCGIATVSSMQEHKYHQEKLSMQVPRVEYLETEEDENHQALKDAKDKTYNNRRLSKSEKEDAMITEEVE